MKAFRIILLLLLFAIVLTFAYQNLERVNVTFIAWSMSLPFSLAFFLSFIMGTIAGGLVVFSSMKRKKDEGGDKSTTITTESPKTENKEQ